MDRRYITQLGYLVSIISVLFLSFPVTDAFNIGVRGTTCSLDPKNPNDPCQSLYNAECDGAHCKCPTGYHEDKTLKRCVAGAKPKGGDEFTDLPFDYVPGEKPKPKSKAPVQPSSPVQPSFPVQPKVPAQPQAPVEDPHVAEKTGGGIGGGIGLLILGCLVYFCCCRGEKGKSIRSKLPFFKSKEQPGGNYQMQQPAPGQEPNAPPPSAV